LQVENSILRLRLRELLLLIPAVHDGLYDQDMIFPQLARFTDVALLLLRIMVGIVFITSGWKHFLDPEGRSKAIGMSKGLTIFLGAVEFAGSLGVIFGVLVQPAAIGLILIMLGAIQ